jgi:hypothetical protein
VFGLHQANGSLKTLEDQALDSPPPKENLYLKPEMTLKDASKIKLTCP